MIKEMNIMKILYNQIKYNRENLQNRLKQKKLFD